MSDSNEKKDGSCCSSTKSSCCGCKKLFIGILLGILIAVIGHCFICGKGGMCGKPKMCPITMQAPAQQ